MKNGSKQGRQLNLGLNQGHVTSIIFKRKSLKIHRSNWFASNIVQSSDRSETEETTFFKMEKLSDLGFAFPAQLTHCVFPFFFFSLSVACFFGRFAFLRKPADARTSFTRILFSKSLIAQTDDDFK